jgi:internalin A
MKQILYLMILILTTVLINSCSPEDENGEPDPDDVVTFADYNLERCVRDELRTEETDLLYKDVSRIMFLDCTGYGIESLSGMENLPILKGAELGNNKIKDVTPLGKCVKLRDLELDNNEIKDASPLKDLVNLTRLNIYDNSISDISYVKDMVNLNSLYTGGNPISDISPIANLTNLVSFSCADSKISELPELSNLQKLENFRVKENKITSLKSIKSLLNLKLIDVRDNCITDFSPIDYLKENGDLTSVQGNSSKDQDYSRCK